MVSVFQLLQELSEFPSHKDSDPVGQGTSLKTADEPNVDLASLANDDVEQNDNQSLVNVNIVFLLLQTIVI